MKRKDLQALTLVEPTMANPVTDPLVLLHVDNRQYIFFFNLQYVLRSRDDTAKSTYVARFCGKGNYDEQPGKRLRE